MVITISCSMIKATYDLRSHLSASMRVILGFDMINIGENRLVYDLWRQLVQLHYNYGIIFFLKIILF